MAGRVPAWPGVAAQGRVRGMAGQGGARQGKAWFKAWVTKYKRKGGVRMRDQTIISSAVVKIQAITMGSTIHHLVLAEMLETKQKLPRYYNLVNQLQKKLMKESGIYLDNEHSVGYRIVGRGEEINVCEEKVKGGYRKVFQGVKNMTYIEVDKMPEAKKNITIAKANKWAVLGGMLKQGIKDIDKDNAIVKA